MTREEIISADKGSGGMFAVIPGVVLKDHALSKSAILLYGIITWKCNENSCCWASNRTLADELGLSPKRVSALISDLEANGHIETEIEKDPETGEVKFRRIYPIVKSSRRAADPILKNEDTPPQTRGEVSLNSGGGIPKNEEEKYKYKYKNKLKEESPPNPPRGERRKSQFELEEEAKPVLRAYCGEDQELAQALADLIDIRTRKKAINSRRAIVTLLNELDRLSDGRREDKLLLIRQSVTNSWKSIFPLRAQRSAAHRQLDSGDIFAEMLMDEGGL